VFAFELIEVPVEQEQENEDGEIGEREEGYRRLTSERKTWLIDRP
jgi:hypothetical protein